MTNYVAVFNESFSRVVEGDKQSTFFDHFYRRFLISSPAVAAKFVNTDFDRQKEMLRRSVTELLQIFTTHTSTPYLQMLAAIHSKADKDIGPALYDDWLRSLIETLKDLDPNYDDTVALAWKIVLAPGIQFMKHHYE